MPTKYCQGLASPADAVGHDIKPEVMTKAECLALVLRSLARALPGALQTGTAPTAGPVEMGY